MIKMSISVEINNVLIVDAFENVFQRRSGKGLTSDVLKIGMRQSKSRIISKRGLTVRPGFKGIGAILLRFLRCVKRVKT